MTSHFSDSGPYPLGSPAVGSSHPQTLRPRARTFDLHGHLLGLVLPRDAQSLRSTPEIDTWFRRHWYAACPVATTRFRHACVAAISQSGFATLVVVGPQVRAAYLAAWMGDVNVVPTCVARYVDAFDELGSRATLDDGGLIAEVDAAAEPVEEVVRAVRAAGLLGHLATELGAISSLATQ